MFTGHVSGTVLSPRVRALLSYQPNCNIPFSVTFAFADLTPALVPPAVTLKPQVLDVGK